MRASRFFVQGQRLAANDQIDEALNAFEQALCPAASNSRDTPSLRPGLSAANRLDEAVSAMQKAMAIEPNNAVLPMFLGLILFDHTDYAEAQAWCEQSLRLNPRQLRAQALLALIDLAQGRVIRGYERLQQSQQPSVSMLERLALDCRMTPATSLISANQLHVAKPFTLRAGITSHGGRRSCADAGRPARPRLTAGSGDQPRECG